MPLTLTQAHLLSAYFAISYVSSIFVLPGGRLRLETPFARRRDDPSVMKTRMIAVSISTLLSCLVVGFVISTSSPSGATSEDTDILQRLGAYPSPLVLSYIVTPLLYLGPLYALFLEGTLPGQRFWSYQSRVRPLYASWMAFRNHFVGPITEEIVFRACILAVYSLAIPSLDRSTKVKLIWLTPLSFGAAHAHHAYETWFRLGKTRKAAMQALIQTLVQLSYTNLFGAHCAFLFLRTGSVWPGITAHMWCNVMGLPQPAYEMSRFPNRKIGIIAAYILGVGAYWYGMRNWTTEEGKAW